ncbi:hypothetical protein FAI41_07810 [Acetobacteraceae bacterium]|nr:hypothetical protein FAI41_07810 [Acetobacteraceae bacterium]
MDEDEFQLGWKGYFFEDFPDINWQEKILYTFAIPLSRSPMQQQLLADRIYSFLRESSKKEKFSQKKFEAHLANLTAIIEICLHIKESADIILDYWVLNGHNPNHLPSHNAFTQWHSKYLDLCSFPETPQELWKNILPSKVAGLKEKNKRRAKLYDMQSIFITILATEFYGSSTEKIWTQNQKDAADWLGITNHEKTKALIAKGCKLLGVHPPKKGHNPMPFGQEVQDSIKAAHIREEKIERIQKEMRKLRQYRENPEEYKSEIEALGGEEGMDDYFVALLEHLASRGKSTL